MNSITLLKACRACGNPHLRKVFSLPPMPLANSFRLPDEPIGRKFPLTVLWCDECHLAQLRETVDPEVLYANYPYVTSASQTMLRHFESLWSEIKTECIPESAIEIGSNDGRMLQFLKGKGVDRVCGIEPAENLFSLAMKEGITTINSLFDKHAAEIVHGVVPRCDLIVARHVFAHVDDWHAFVKNLDVLAGKETLIAIELPYLVDMLEKAELDQCYHEHLSYASIRSFWMLLEHTPFHIHKVKFYPIHGGAMVLFIRRNDSEWARLPLPYEFIHPTAWEDFNVRAWRRIEDLKLKVHALVGSGKLVAGYGASAKSSVWISACGFTSEDIRFIVDSTPQKIGRLSPGTCIPIVPEEEIEKADVAVCCAWNFLLEIKEKLKPWIEKGGILINPHHPESNVAQTLAKEYSKT